MLPFEIVGWSWKLLANLGAVQLEVGRGSIAEGLLDLYRTVAEHEAVAFGTGTQAGPLDRDGIDGVRFGLALAHFVRLARRIDGLQGTCEVSPPGCLSETTGRCPQAGFF